VSSKEINYFVDRSTGRILSAICPLCTSKLQPAVLKDHFARRHPYASLDNWQPPRPQKTIRRQNGKGQLKRPEKAGLGWKEDQIHALEALRQSFDETRDGSKGLGHMRREWNGQFGSFPLYDDYGDESDAE
jgi:hypothetical protein